MTKYGDTKHTTLQKNFAMSDLTCPIRTLGRKARGPITYPGELYTSELFKGYL